MHAVTLIDYTKEFVVVPQVFSVEKLLCPVQQLLFIPVLKPVLI